MDIEGIYRICGSFANMQKLMDLYDSGQPVDLTHYDKFVITGVIKKYFAFLTEPIMTFGLYEEFILTHQLKDHVMKANATKTLVKKLPEGNFKVLKFVIQHLCMLVQYESVTKMSMQNLAIVFGPTLFRAQGDSATRILQDSGFLASSVFILIKYFDFIFEDKPLLFESSSGNLNRRQSQPESEFQLKQNSLFEKRRRKKNDSSSAKEINKETIYNQILDIIYKVDNKPAKLDHLRQSNPRSSTSSSNSNSDSQRELLLNGFLSCNAGNKLPIVIEYSKVNPLATTNSTGNTSVHNGQGDLATSHYFGGIGSLEELKNISKVVDNDMDKIEEKLNREYEITGDLVVNGSVLALLLERMDLIRRAFNRSEVIDQMGLVELKDEKQMIKEELSLYEKVFFEKTGRYPTVNDREPLRPLYFRYLMVKSRILLLLDQEQQLQQMLKSDAYAATEAADSADNESKRVRRRSTKDVPIPPAAVAAGGGTISTDQKQQQPQKLMVSSASIDLSAASSTISVSGDNVEKQIATTELFHKLKKEKVDLQKILYQHKQDLKRQGKKFTKIGVEKEFARYQDVKSQIRKMTLQNTSH